MKVIKVIFIGFVILLGSLFCGLFILLRSIDVNKYIPQVVEAVGKATGRQMAIARAGLGFSFSNGLVLELKDISLSDDPKFSVKPFLNVASVRLAIDVRAVLASKSVVVSDITIVEPELTIISAKDGNINAVSLGGPAKVSTQVVARSADLRPVESVSAEAWPVFFVKKIIIKGGKVHYVNRLVEPEIAVDVEKIVFVVNNFSLNDTFDFSLGAALFSGDVNTNMTGSARLDIAQSAVSLEAVKMVLVADSVLPEKLNSSLPNIRPLGFKHAGGGISVELKDAVVGAKGLASLDAQVAVQLKDVMLEGVNVLASGLNSIPMLPGLMDAVMSDLPAETQTDMKKGITLIDRLEILAKADSDVLSISKAEMSTRDLAVSANGTVLMTGMLDIEAQLFIAPKLSEVLVNKTSDLEGIKNKDGRIYVPFVVKGLIVKPQINPDIDYLSKNLLISRGKKELQKVLGDPAVGEAVGELLNSFFKKN